MSRWSGDAFYKVLVASLVTIALAFCLVFTNVFIDLDGLLHVKKDKAQKLQTTKKPIQSTSSVDYTTGQYYNTEINYYDMDYNYRTKRSSDTQNLLLQMKQSKMKNLLTHGLAKLLDQLDAAETTEVNKNDRITNEKSKELKEDQKEDTKQQAEDTDGLLHSAMHEILLLGLKGHIDFNEVYQRIHKLITEFDKANKETRQALRANTEHTKLEALQYPKINYLTDERKLLDELLDCKKLQDNIAEDVKKPTVASRRESHVPKIIIKTVIDINELTDKKMKMGNESSSRENVKGLVKLVYNGKSIQFSRLDDEKAQTNVNKETNPKLDTEFVTKVPKYDEIADLLSKYTKRAKSENIKEYFKNYDGSSIKNIKRLKRHIKIRYENDEVTETIKNKKGDDELFVEIETHFDSKGMRGDKKKKLISNLVEKIQKAIHSGSDGKKVDKKINSTTKNVKQKKRKHIHVKKRIQNPLNKDNDVVLRNKIMLPYEAVVHRQLNPIAKVVPLQESMPYVSDKYGQAWNKQFYGPAYLAATKSINSAEMSEVKVDYNKAIDEVSQRIQKPLNDEIADNEVSNAYYDLGKLKFLMKDIDGSGFSVGYNQYVDEQPDPEAMKLFTGLENIIQTYHQAYDQGPENEAISLEKKHGVHEVDYDQNEHLIARRSIQRNKHDHHSNEYKVIYENNFMPYENYEDILNHNTKLSIPTSNYNTENFNTVKSKHKSKASRFVIDEGMFEKKLKPAEILGLANLLQRKKRSINVQKISNLKNKMKLNRYLNTKAIATKRIYLNKKRSKRQIDKIRIIATDDMPLHKHSDEIFVVSNENIFADRAVVREVETPELEPEKVVEDHYDFISPIAPAPHMDQMPYIYEEQVDQPFVTNVFGGRFRHNSLMSKYPHIFLEDLGRSREEFLDNPMLYNKIDEHNNVEIPSETTTVLSPTISNIPPPKIEGSVKTISPQNAKTNYKVTVKILPKNISDLNSGFKEIHTSINKSYNRNGILYSSLVNVSEISKIIKLNKTKEIVSKTGSTTTQSPMLTHFRRQQETMNHILKQHNHRIDEQLSNLHKEKERLENFSIKNETMFQEPRQNEFIEVIIPSNPPKALHLTKEEVNRLAVASLINFNRKEMTQTSTPTTTVVIPYTTETPKINTERTQLIDKMERNERMTNEILKKIDKNTQILRVFLEKLTDKINTKKIETKSTPDINKMQEFKHIPAPFNQVMPNMEGNGSHVAIPFIYAYQQPYTLPVNKPEVPVASVVYHGHIHTNTINGNKEWPAREVKKDLNAKNVNQTRFFIDELENDYKVMPVLKKAFGNVRNNTGV